MTAGNAVRVVALSAGMRAASSTRALSDALVSAVVDHLARRAESATSRTVEVRGLATDVARASVDGVRSAALVDGLGAVEGADVLIAATPVYNGSYTGLFKSFVDLLDPAALLGKTVVLAATGGSLRHSLVPDNLLRPLFAFFQAAPVPTAVYATGEDWARPGHPGAALTARIDRAAWEAVSVADLGGSAAR